MDTSFSLTDMFVNDTEAEGKGEQENVQMVVDRSGDLEDETDEIDAQERIEHKEKSEDSIYKMFGGDRKMLDVV